MSFEVRNAKRAKLDTFEARNVTERGEVFNRNTRDTCNSRCAFSTIGVLQAFCEINSIEIDYASEYGEPGYADPTKGILFSNWNDIPKSLQDRLEAQGYALEWSDEWYVDSDAAKAWRTEPTHMGWVPRVRYGDGDIITPDSDPDEWIDSAKNDEDNALPYWFDTDELTSRGWEEIEEHSRHFADHAHASLRRHVKAGRDALLVYSECYTVWVHREYTELDDVLTALEDERTVTRDQCTKSVLDSKIWVAGAGSPGCLYDLGPEYHATKESAVDSMVKAIGYEMDSNEGAIQDETIKHEACESLGMHGSYSYNFWRYEVSESTLGSIL